MLDRGFVGDIAGNLKRTFAERTNFFCGGPHKIHTAARRDDVGAGLREAFGDFQADTAGAADDKRGIVVQFQARMTHVFAPFQRIRKAVRFYSSKGAIA